MGRGVGVDAQARRFRDRPDQGDGRALAVGARDMDHRRQPVLRIAERGAQGPHPVQRQVDALGMPGAQAFRDRVHQGWLYAAFCVWAVPLISMDRIRPSVVGRSARDTTLSTMPLSLRYSARWKPGGSFSRMVV